MDNLKYQDYVDLGIYPALDENGTMHFSKPNIDFIIDKYLKLKNQFEEFKKRSEAEEDIFYSQFLMARASADYYEHECKSLKEQIRDIKDYNERRVRFEEINKGLRRECQRYKKECQDLQQENARLQQQLKQAKEIINDPNTLMAQQSELIDNLTRQLAEKDKEIEVISSSKKHFKTCAENMLDVLKTINSVLPKPQENGLNYKKVADDVVALIKEKDKEIEVLRKDEYQKCCQHCDAFEELVAISKQEQKELAIQELEKVKDWLEPKYFDYEQINYLNNIIDNQINDLKMGKDYMPINTKGEQYGREID